jgi:ABC-type sugar transport system ATPase subunit
MSTEAAIAVRPRSATHVEVPQLRLRNLHKRFAGVHALRGADLALSRAGVVHGLIGQNGSGKSTLLGILSGQLRPDAGTIEFNGNPIAMHGTLDAVRRGIVMVSQETALVPDLTVAENILLGGRQVRGPGGISWPRTLERASEQLRELDLDYDPEATVRRMRPDQQQMIEIARALSLDAEILILDEPTSSLTDDEADRLFRAVRRLAARGVSTIFVSHRLDELLDLSDEITVLRDGRTVAHGAAPEFDSRRIVEEMVGHPVGTPIRKDAALSVTRTAPVALSLRNVATAGVVRDIDLDLHRGEILGLAGLVGAGRSELLEAIFGLRPLTAGRMALGSQAFAPRGPEHAIARGVGFVPPDRKHQGLALQRSIAENLLMVATRHVGRLRAPASRANAASVREMCAALKIAAVSEHASASTLSGGNQQKLVIGKWILAQSSVLLLDNPTRGVDVAAKSEIHALLRERADGGAALLVSSAEPSELIELCDRIIVLFRGHVVAELSAREATEARLAHLAGGEYDRP